MTRFVTSALTAVAALLILALAGLWFSPVTPWRHWSPPPPQAPNLNDAQAALLSAQRAAAAAYPAVLERPLFQPSRRPEADAENGAAANNAPPPAAIEQVKLLGLVSGHTLTGVLLEEQGAQRFVRRDEQVDGWTLSAIEGRYAVFTRGDQRKQIELPNVSLSPANGASPPPASQPAPSSPASGWRAATPPPSSNRARPSPAAAAAPNAQPASMSAEAHADTADGDVASPPLPQTEGSAR